MRFGSGDNQSSNIEDRRGMGGMGRTVGVGGSAVLLILSLLFGRNLFEETGIKPGVAVNQGGDVGLSPQDSAREAPKYALVANVLDDANETWSKLLPGYKDARLVLYRDATQTGCGTGQAMMGPFYCPLDQRVYLDLGFYDELGTKFGAPGQFAQAYVLAHEIGHHVQNMLGTDAKVRRAMEQDPGNANQYSVRLELQADCYAGVWGHTAQQRNMLEPGEMEQGLQAASSVGDDRLQKASTGRVNSDSFTHGSSAQRMTWFKRGMDSGDPRVCDTFGS